MPAVITTKSNFVPATSCPCDPYCDRVRFTARAREAHHIRPRMQLDQALREIDLLRTIESAHVARTNRRMNCVIHFWMAITQDIRADSHQRHVNILGATEIPDSATLGAAEIGGPLLWQEHLGTLGQQHVAAGDDAFRSFPQLLPSAELLTLVAHE